jgi:type II secretion system protein C
MNEKRLSRLFRGFQALLVGLLVFVAVDAALRPLQLSRVLDPNPAAGNPPAVAPERTPQPPAPVDVPAIVAADLFANAAAVTAERNDDRQNAIAPSEVPVEKEDLRLRLVGVVAGGPTSSLAVIADTGTQITRLYRIGDAIASAVVESIRPGEVVLNREGNRITLHFRTATPEANTGKSAGALMRAGRPRSKTSSAAAEPPVKATKMGYVEDIFRKATVEPCMQDGQARGLRITGLENTPVGELFGLRNGDIVERVNGQDLTDKQKAFQILQKARTQRTIHIELQRGGKTRSLSFDL